MSEKKKPAKYYCWGCPECGHTQFERVVTIGATQEGEFSSTSDQTDWGEPDLEDTDVEADDIHTAEEFECKSCGASFKEPGRIYPKPDPKDCYPGEDPPSLAGKQHVVVRVFVANTPIKDGGEAYVLDEEKEKTFSKRIEFVTSSQVKVDAIIAAAKAMLAGLEE